MINMDKYGGEFKRRIIFDMRKGLRPVYLEQTNIDSDTGERMGYDTSMEQTYITELLQKYSEWFRKIFKSTWSRFADNIYTTRAVRRQQHG